MPYRRLMAAVVVINVAILVGRVRAGAWQLADGSALSALSTLTLVNLTVAVLVRTQAFLNALYGVAGRGSPTWPLSGGASRTFTTSAGCTWDVPSPGRRG